jgi:hypothetical protein
VCVCVFVCVCVGNGAIHAFWHVFDRQAAWRRRGLGGDRVTGSDKVSIRMFCRLINLFRHQFSCKSGGILDPTVNVRLSLNSRHERCLKLGGSEGEQNENQWEASR